MSEPMALDAFDRCILEVVSREGRIGIADLATRVGLSKSPVQARLRRLEARGVIRGWRALLDPGATGRERVAVVEVRLGDTREAALAEFTAAVLRIPEIEACPMIAGSFGDLLEVRTGGMAAHRAMLAQHISRLPHVAATETVKEEG